MVMSQFCVAQKDFSAMQDHHCGVDLLLQL